MTREEAIAMVKQERDRQIKLWGYSHDERHSGLDWTAILAIYVGRFGSAVEEGDRLRARESLVRLAAVAVAALEVSRG